MTYPSIASALALNPGISESQVIPSHWGNYEEGELDQQYYTVVAKPTMYLVNRDEHGVAYPILHIQGSLSFSNAEKLCKRMNA